MRQRFAARFAWAGVVLLGLLALAAVSSFAGGRRASGATEFSAPCLPGTQLLKSGAADLLLPLHGAVVSGGAPTRLQPAPGRLRESLDAPIARPDLRTFAPLFRRPPPVAASPRA